MHLKTRKKQMSNNKKYFGRRKCFWINLDSCLQCWFKCSFLRMFWRVKARLKQKWFLLHIFLCDNAENCAEISTLIERVNLFKCVTQLWVFFYFQRKLWHWKNLIFLFSKKTMTLEKSVIVEIMIQIIGVKSQN